MTASEREQLRMSLVRLLGSNRTSFSVQESLLLALVRSEGARWVNATILRDELVYLEEKGLVVHDVKIVSPENRNWRVSAAGRDWLAELGIE